jgi:hypothetical protein
VAAGVGGLDDWGVLGAEKLPIEMMRLPIEMMTVMLTYVYIDDICKYSTHTHTYLHVYIHTKDMVLHREMLIAVGGVTLEGSPAFP